MHKKNVPLVLLLTLLFVLRPSNHQLYNGACERACMGQHLNELLQVEFLYEKREEKYAQINYFFDQSFDQIYLRQNEKKIIFHLFY